jgi:hypothetical protein
LIYLLSFKGENWFYVSHIFPVKNSFLLNTTRKKKKGMSFQVYDNLRNNLGTQLGYMAVITTHYISLFLFNILATMHGHTNYSDPQKV